MKMGLRRNQDARMLHSSFLGLWASGLVGDFLEAFGRLNAERKGNPVILPGYWRRGGEAD